MQSTSLLSRNAVDISSINKSEVSKGLFGQIQWDDIIRSGVSLQARDVRTSYSYVHIYTLINYL